MKQLVSLDHRRPSRLRPAHKRLYRGVLLVLASGWLAVVLANYYTQFWHLAVALSSGHFDLAGPGLSHLPYLASALARAASGMTGATLTVGSAIVVGTTISRVLSWRYTSWREALPSTFSIGMGVLSYTGLVLAMVGHYRMVWLRLLILLPLAAAGLWWLRRGPRSTFPHLRFRRWPTHVRSGIWAGCAVSALLMAAVAALAPEREYDALWYHLAYPRLFLEQGRLIDRPTDYVSLYPMTWELWFGYGLALGGQTTATLLHFACLPLGALLTYQTARAYVPRASPWLAVALLTTTPLAMWEASTAYIDLALALHVTLAVYGLLNYVERNDWQWLIIAALNLGLALATKHLALVVLLLTCVGLTLQLLSRRGTRDLRQVLVPAALLACLSLLLPLPWYIRSLRASGSPVFPELYPLLGSSSSRWSITTERGLQSFLDQFGRTRTLGHLLTLPWDMTVHAADYGGTLGPLFLMLLPVLMLTRWQRAVPWLSGFAACYIAFWASPLSSFQMRFLVPILPLFSLLAARAFSRLQALVRSIVGARAGEVMVAGLALLLMLNLPPFTFLHERDRVQWTGWLTSTLHGVPLKVVFGAETRDQYLARVVPSYNVWQFANRTLPVEARILTWTGGDDFYAHRDRIWSNSTAAQPVAWARAGQEAVTLAGLRRLGITHLIVVRSEVTDDVSKSTALLSPQARSTWYDLLYEDPYAMLYRVRWEHLAVQPNGAVP